MIRLTGIVRDHRNRTMTDKSNLITEALVILSAAGIETDVLELLVWGNPDKGVAPGALQKALEAAAVRGMEQTPEILEAAIVSSKENLESGIIPDSMESDDG